MISRCNDFSAVKPISVTNALAFLLLLAPLMRGQNADELLVFRLPGRNGYIDQPGAPPFPPLRAQSFAPSRATNCRSKAAGCGSVWSGNCPSLAMGKCKLGHQVVALGGHCASDLVGSSSHGTSPGGQGRSLSGEGGHKANTYLYDECNADGPAGSARGH